MRTSERDPPAVSAFTATSCLGAGVEAHRDALRAGRSGLAPCRFMGLPLETWVGEVAGVDAERLPPALTDYDCRNNRLAWLGLQQDGFADAVRATVDRVGAARTGVYLGTSTSGLLSTELAYRARDPATGALPAWFRYAQTHNMASLASFVAQAFAIEGPRQVVSTACSSSAKAFGAAWRALAAGLIDAAVVGGVDSLCLTTLYGFRSLELLSREPCRPFDAERSGISIGEAAAFALLVRGEAADPVAPRLVGCGESSDAHHMSAPHPSGLGAERAMRAALAMADIAPATVDYVNLHGTATPSNDLAEDAAVRAVFGEATPVSSTKGAHGHTLGAAGGLEAAISLLCLHDGFMPAGLNTRARDPALGCNYLLAPRTGPLACVASNSFGFGGSNCTLVFARGAR